MMNSNSSRPGAPEPSVTRPEPREPGARAAIAAPRAVRRRAAACTRSQAAGRGAASLRVGSHLEIPRRIVGAGRSDRSGQRRRIDHPYAEPHHRHRRHDEGRYSRPRHRHRRQGRGRPVRHRVGQYPGHRQGQGQCVCAARRHQRRRVLPGPDRHAALGCGRPGAQRAPASGRHGYAGALEPAAVDQMLGGT